MMSVIGFVMDADFLECRGIGRAEWVKLCSAYSHLNQQPELLLRVFDYIKDRGLQIDSRHVIVNLVTTEFGQDDIEIIPTIEAYRAIAHNSGEFAGGEVVEEGPETTINYNGFNLTAPKYIVYSVKRFVNGLVVEWKAKEYLTENVVLDSLQQPVSFWRQRPIGQLTIRAEAQALRRAFKSIDNYTAEELSVPASANALTGKRIADGDLSPAAGSNALDTVDSMLCDIDNSDIDSEAAEAPETEKTGEVVEVVIEKITRAKTIKEMDAAVMNLPNLEHQEMNEILNAYQAQKAELLNAG
jgi:hypothetical protein